MKVIVSDEVLASAIGTDAIVKIHRLLAYSASGRHHVFFESSASEIAALQTFSEGARPYYSEALKRGARSASAYPNDWSSIRISNTTAPTWGDPVAILSLDQSLEVLDQRLGILLENAQNDWNFLLGIMRRSDSRRLLQIVEKGWAEPLHGGGTTMRALLEDRINSPAKGLRTFAIFDSDRLHADELLPEWTPARPGERAAECKAYEWENYCLDAMPLRYWRLRRRFIESYMPRTQLQIAAAPNTHRDAHDVYFRLPKEIRWYFNVKDGLAGDRRRLDNARLRDSFNNLLENEIAALNNGFGSTIAKHYERSVSNSFDWDQEANDEAAAAIPALMRLL
jgi:hypothetical protein